MSYYKILDLPENSTKEEVKKAYRRLSKIYHPDINGGDEKKTAQFVKIKEAYESILKGITGINIEKNKTKSYRESNVKESFEVIKGHYDKDGNYCFTIKASYIQKIYYADNIYTSNIYFDLCSWSLDEPNYNGARITIDKKDLKKQNYIVNLRIVGWVSGNITYKKYRIKRPKGIINKIIDYVSSIF